MKKVLLLVSGVLLCIQSYSQSENLSIANKLNNCVSTSQSVEIKKFHTHLVNGYSNIVFGKKGDSDFYPIHFKLNKSKNTNGEVLKLKNIYLGRRAVWQTYYPKWQVFDFDKELRPLFIEDPNNPGSYIYFTGPKRDEVYISPLELPDNNLGFGERNGIVKFEFDNNTDLFSDDSGSGIKDFKARLFFVKDDENPYSNPGTPNWFYYWKQAPEIQDLLNSIPGIKLYNESTCEFNNSPTPPNVEIRFDNSLIDAYGSSQFNHHHWDPVIKSDIGCAGITDPDNNTVLTSYKKEDGSIHSEIISLSDACGFKKQVDVRHEYLNTTNIEGIHTFYTVVLHEVEHCIIKCEIWADGYSQHLDMDFDGYRDDWENNSHIGILYEFHSEDNSDKYSGDYNPTELIKPEEGNPGSGCPTHISAGTCYEENRCRDKEVEYYENQLLNNIDDSDWSYDPSNEIQGKQWEK